jgi:phosphoglycolate phosphatase-like HAD superfamily hydrolase
MTLCLVFDFDGVLVDSNAIKRRAYRDIFASVPDSQPVVDEVLRADAEDDRWGVIRSILRGLGPAAIDLEAQVARYAERYNAICEEHAATCREVPGAAAALDSLSQRHPLYVVSATPEEPLRRIVARRGWTGYFREVLGRPRTKRENLARVMRREHIGPEGIVFVGDGRRDLDAARSTGCGFLGVRNEFNDFDPSGVTMLDDLTSLRELIDSSPNARATGRTG